MPGHAIFDIQNTYGYAFIGLVISLMLFGISILQTWIYYWHYQNRDPKSLKSFVLALFFLDALHTILCIYVIYWYLVLNFGNVENLNSNMWAMNIQVDINTLVGYMVQLYYARRVYIVSKSIIIPAIIAILGTVCFALGFVFTVKAFAIKVYSNYSGLIPITCIGMGSAVVADILIALSMCWYLYHKRTGYARTDSMITTLMTYSINSGLLTSILASAVLIGFSSAPATMISQIFFSPMGKCYTNSLLAMLNSRDHVRERSTTDDADNALDLSSFRIGEADRSKSKRAGRATVSVTVHRSATSDFPQGKLDHDIERAVVDISKSEASTIPSVHGRMSESSV